MELRNNLAISDSGFVFDAANGESYSLNPIGLEIIKYLNDGLSDEAIRTKIVDKYDVDESNFDLVYFDFIRTLQQHALFQRS